jgi:hypothetical protein
LTPPHMPPTGERIGVTVRAEKASLLFLPTVHGEAVIDMVSEYVDRLLGPNPLFDSDSIPRVQSRVHISDDEAIDLSVSSH